MTVNVVGAENIEPGTSYVITSNHQSHYDIFVLYGWLGVDFKWVMKKELEKVPVLGWHAKSWTYLYWTDPTRKALLKQSTPPKQKLSMELPLFFSRKAREAATEDSTFQKGAFKFAIDLGIPILPVTINGTRKVLRKEALI